RSEDGVLALEDRSSPNRRPGREPRDGHLLDRQHLFRAEGFARRNLAVALVARAQSLQALLETGKHFPVAVNVTKWSGACGRFEHADAFHFQLVFEIDDSSLL